MIITATQFLQEVRALGFECWAPRDRQVFCPSQSWLDEFWEYLRYEPVLGKPESWDCDDFALRAVTEASIACRKAGGAAGHTFVYCSVRLWGPLNGIEPDAQNITGHATNMVRLNDGRFLFFEPQNGEYCDAKIAISVNDVVPVNALL